MTLTYGNGSAIYSQQQIGFISPDELKKHQVEWYARRLKQLPKN